MPDTGKRRPNILFVVTDQQRWNCLGCHGHPVLRTPHLDALAAGGVDFQRAYAQAPECMPSRTTMLTGQYPHTHGVQNNSNDLDVGGLTMLPALLRGNGYQTALVGKSHFGPSAAVGFDYTRLHTGANRGEKSDYADYLARLGLREAGDKDCAYKFYDAYVRETPWEHAHEQWTGSEALRFLSARDRAKPFFACVSFRSPHAPTSVPPDNPFPYNPDDIELPEADLSFYDGLKKRRAGCENMWNVHHTGPEALRRAIANYLSLISMVDHQVGRLVAALKDEGALEDTIIVFTSDHGDYCGEYGQFGKQHHGHDVILRVPLIIAQAGVTGREEIHDLVELVDVMPTLLEMAGLPCPRTVQGESLAPAVYGSGRRGGDGWEGKEAVFFERAWVKSVRTKTHRLSFCYRGDKEWGELFDLRDDPGETRNLYGDPAFAWVQHELERELLRWFIRTGQPRVAHGRPGPPWRWFRSAPAGPGK